MWDVSTDVVPVIIHRPVRYVSLCLLHPIRPRQLTDRPRQQYTAQLASYITQESLQTAMTNAKVKVVVIGCGEWELIRNYKGLSLACLLLPTSPSIFSPNSFPTPPTPPPHTPSYPSSLTSPPKTNQKQQPSKAQSTPTPPAKRTARWE